MEICRVHLTQTVCLKPVKACTPFVCSKASAYRASKVIVIQCHGAVARRTLLTRKCRQASRSLRRLCIPTAWADGLETAVSASLDQGDLREGDSKFKQLCQAQLKLVSSILSQSGGQSASDGSIQGAFGTNLTLYKREPATFEAGQLQLSKVISYTNPGDQKLPDELDSTLFLGLAGNGQYSRGAEKALTEAQLVDLPNTGAFVLPLAAHTFLVGLLVIEQLAPPIQPVPSTAADVVQPAQLAAVSPGEGEQGQGAGAVVSGQHREVVQLAGQVLAAACAMDLHSALERAQASMRSQQVIGLVEEARGPLSALRTLGSILVPRLRQKEGQEIDREMAQGILTQGDRLQEVVSQLQAAIHPLALSSSLDPFQPAAPTSLPTSSETSKGLPSKPKQSLLPPVKQDSSADEQLHK